MQNLIWKRFAEAKEKKKKKVNAKEKEQKKREKEKEKEKGKTVENSVLTFSVQTPWWNCRFDAHEFMENKNLKKKAIKH